MILAVVDWNEVQALARTPRAPSSELVEVLGNRSAWATVGCAGLALGLPLVMVAALGTIFSRYALVGVVLGLIVALVSGAMLIVSRRQGRRLAERAAAELPLVLVGVVQGNDALFRPEGAYAGAVFVFTTDPSRGLDHAWLTRVVTNVATLKNQGSPDPQLARLVQALWDPHSLPDEVLPASITEGVPARIYATAIDAEKLPGRRIPDSRMLPALLDDTIPVFLPAALWT